MATAMSARYTPEDLLSISDRLMPELVNGVLLEREPLGQKADLIASAIIYQLIDYSHEVLPGVVNGPQGSYQVFPDDPDNVRIPDASFTRRDRLPDGKAFEGHSRIAPDLVVELVSPVDRVVELEAKIADLQSAGAPLIWIVHLKPRTVRAYTPLGAGPLLRTADTLRGGDILPEFECPVAAIFADS